jgi:Tol biopolymer transport system component
VPDTHPHAYVTPDRRWVIFNSDRTGRLQVYAAAVPTELVAGLTGPG